MNSKAMIRPGLRLELATWMIAGISLLGMGMQPALQAQEANPGQNADADLIPFQLFGLIHAPEVHEELGLSSQQVASLEQFFGQIDGPWFRARNLQPEQNRVVLAKLEAAARQWFKKNMTPEQVKRLEQLEYRAQGIRMLLRPELGSKIGMTEAQRSQFADLARQAQTAALELQKAVMGNQVTDELKNRVRETAQAEQDGLQKILQPQQLQVLSQELGQPFDTSRLKRIYPMAPELVSVSDWINSSPLTLKQLRGKVVILHFYAFQCHNCHANFGHYKKWHEQYGDDVVVLGIQTPETAMERNSSAVKQAAQERGLEFPIMVDLQSENWKAWSNTMWPTVYVVDKKGYIRQWWQGELNWNGATGDEKIQSVVQDLLNEDA